MSPSNAMQDIANRIMRDTVSSPNASLPLSQSRKAADRSDFFGIQSRHTYLLPARLAAFLEFVVDVVSVRSEEEMVRPNAELNVTAMENMQPVSTAYKALVSKLMCAYGLALIAESAIATSVRLSCPHPTLPRFMHEGPKSKIGASFLKTRTPADSAGLTVWIQRAGTISIKVRCGFCRFASAAEFLYNGISHDLNFLNRGFSIVVRPVRMFPHSFGSFVFYHRSSQL